MIVPHRVDEALLLADCVRVWTENSSRITEDVTVSFKRPRTVALERDPAYSSLKERVFDALQRDFLRRAAPSSSA